MRISPLLVAPALGVAVLFVAAPAMATVDDDELPRSLFGLDGPGGLDPRLDPRLDEDDVREAGGLEALEALGPLELRGGSFGFTLRGGVGWGKTTLGPTLRWQGELLLYLPLDRLLGTFARAGSLDPPASPASSAPPTTTTTEHPANPGETMSHAPRSMPPPRRARWSTLAAIPGALALGGVAAAKDQPGLPPVAVGSAAKLAASGSASTAAFASTSASASTSSATTISSVEAPAAGVTIELGPPIALSSQSMRGLIDAAWRAAGLDGDEALADLAARAKASALAPEVRLRAHRTLTYGARVLSADTLADRTTLSDDTQTFLEARLTWRLDRLVFADEEVAVERVRLERIDKRHRLGAEVVELALAWQRARRAAVDPDLLPQEREDAAMRAIESFLALDALTVGAATRLLRAGPALR